MTKDRATITQQTTVTEIDYNTGEIKSKTQNTSKNLPRQPNYIKLYLKDILYLTDLQTNQSGLLYQLLMRTTYGTNDIVLNSYVKKQIAEQLNISVGTIDNNLSKFVEGKILERVGRGVYKANPYLFGNGEWANILEMRENQINLSINYDANGRTFQTEINNVQKQKEELKKQKEEDLKEEEQNKEESKTA